MLKSFKGKMMLVSLFLLAAFVYPATLYAAAFTSFEVNATTVNAGQPVNITVRTTGANYVFANVAGANIPATMRPGGATGDAVWDLAVSPATNQMIVVHANVTNSAEGSATISFPVTVNVAAVTPAQPQPPVTGAPGAHRIYSITETEAPRQDTVTLTIVTDAGVNYVWLNQPGAESQILGQATRTGTSEAQSTWEVTYRPRQYVAHEVQVNANNAYVLDNRRATQNFNVVLAAPFVRPVEPSIGRASISPSTIEPGARTTITVRTNADVNYVWAVVDGTRVNARAGNQTPVNRNWTIDVRPDETQTIRVYANTVDSASGATTDTVRVTVRSAEPRITANLSVNRSEIQQGDTVTIDVRTNDVVTHVWARVDGRTVHAQRETGGGTGDRRWSIDVRPNSSGSITVYANTSSGTSGADRRSVNITVRNQWGGW